MKLRQSKVNPEILNAACNLLQGAAPGLTPTALVAALKSAGAPPEPPPLDKPMTRAEAAKALGVTVATVNRWMNTGRLRRIQTGMRLVRIPREDVQALLTPHPTSPTVAPEVNHAE